MKNKDFKDLLTSIGQARKIHREKLKFRKRKMKEINLNKLTDGLSLKATLNKKRCDVCGKKLGRNDFYGLCRKCQPAWVKGYKAGKQDLIDEIRPIIEG